MEMKILWGALMFVAGWFYFYICLRQLIFDFSVGYPLIKRFGALGDEVFGAVGAKRMNTISVIIWFVIVAALGFVALYFPALYLKICFLVGVAVGYACYFSRLSPATRSNFDAFCRTYCRFSADDTLRQGMNDADAGKINASFKRLGSKDKFEFKN